MIKNPKTAKHVSELLHEAFRRLDESTRLVEGTCPVEDFAAYNKAVGGLLGSVVMDLMEPLYEENPDLKPSNWDSPPWKSIDR